MKKPASSPVQKPRDTKGTILRLLRTMTHDRTLFALALALTVAGNLLALAGPKLAGGPSTPSARTPFCGPSSCANAR